MPAARRVALYYPMRPGNAQAFLRGIFHYARPAKPWEFCLTFGWDARRLVDWKPDGVIGHVLTADAAETVEQLTIPVVETAFDFPHLNAARVGLDDAAIGAMAAEHFLSLGFVHCAFVGAEEKAYAARRWEGFDARLRRAGRTAACAPRLLAPGWQDTLPPVRAEALEWLAALPRPASVFAAYDALALQVLEIAHAAGLRVPEDIAVLGVDNLDLLCDLASPPLSSIRTAAEAAGFEAARLLDRLMAGDPPPADRIELPPMGVARRRSTDICSVIDPNLGAALRFLRDNVARPIGVDDLVGAACVSRATLERRFRTALGRSPLDEIRRVRVERARELLADTDRPMAHVAEASGFSDPQHLAEVFRDLTGETPTGFRKRFRRF
jgi:LacI family transcriptional regulator